MMLTFDEVLDMHNHPSSDQEMYDFARAVIAKNNAKVLADLKPVVFARGAFDNDITGYTPDQVSALIQERDALAARVRELEAQAEMDSAQINSLIKKVPSRPDEQPRKARFA